MPDRPLPLVSIVVAVHNSERYLGDALASIVAHDYRPLEVIVVDDGSTDRTAALASSFAGAADTGCTVRYVRQRRGGLQRARLRRRLHASNVFDAPDEKRECFVRTLKFLLDERRRRAPASGPAESAGGEGAP